MLTQVTCEAAASSPANDGAWKGSLGHLLHQDPDDWHQPRPDQLREGALVLVRVPYGPHGPLRLRASGPGGQGLQSGPPAMQGPRRRRGRRFKEVVMKLYFAPGACLVVPSPVLDGIRSTPTPLCGSLFGSCLPISQWLSVSETWQEAAVSLRTLRSLFRYRQTHYRDVRE
jgi:hypothetical protein